MRKLLLAKFVLLMVWSAFAQTPSLQRTDIPISNGSQAILVADFNSDGIADIATLTPEIPSRVGILIGNGDGTFQSPHNIPGLSSVGAFAVSDFNLDGKMDLVVEAAALDGNVHIQILLGRGDGTFQTPIILSFSSSWLAVGDFNGDGKPDLVVTDTSNVVSIALGNGDGTFEALSPARPGGMPLEVPMAVFDLNRDGKLDVVIAQVSSQTLQVLLGNGDGTFQSGGSVSYEIVDEGSTSVAVGDVNGDGKPDIVVEDGSGIGVFLGNGNGTFQNRINHSLGPWEYGVAIGDLNSDGKPDVVGLTDAGHSSGAAWFLPGLGDGTLGSPVRFAIPDGPFNSAIGTGHPLIALVDLNRDGMLDLVTATNSGISVLIHTVSAPVSVTVTSSPIGLSLAVDGTACVTPCNLTLNAGVTPVLLASSPQLTQSGTQLVFSSWSDSGTQLHQIVVPATASTYTAIFKTQFQLNTSVSPQGAGAVAPLSGGYYDAGTSQIVQAAPTAGFQFSSWSGPVANLSQPMTSVTMDAPKSVTAFFTSVAPPSGGLLFVPLKPCRISDTRNPIGLFGGPRLRAGQTRNYPIVSSACGVPSTAAAYSLNVTAVPAGPLSYLTVWPGGGPPPLVSTLNSLDGRVKANAAIVPAGSGATINVFVTDPTDVVLDINGYFVPATEASGLSFYPVMPCRIADTRNAAGPFGGPSFPAGGTRTFLPDQSTCNLPLTAQAYSLNFTAVPKASLGFLTVWPFGQNQPFVSTLNSPTGTIVANAAIVSAGTNFGINAYATDTTDVIIDVNGYFAPSGAPGALSFYTVPPCRMLDTRTAPGILGGPIMSAGATGTYPLLSSACGISSNAKAYSLNATVVPSGPLGYLSLWPTNQPQPVVSTLNAIDGAITGNAAIVPAGAGGAINAFVTGSSDLILDIAGYFAP